MGRIHLLDDALVDKIAAGEVIERPASVVKELVENAIDAGAEAIRVELEDGGKRLIVVTDNGGGIAAEDALMALKRHATSKIKELDDLFTVMTMGFRGEALASIASVSQFTLFSRAEGADSGIKVERDGDGFVDVAWNGPKGTTVRVADLFFNVPVRKGFLKKGASEFAAASDYLTALALSMPEISFTLLHNGREQFAVKGCAAPGDEGGIFKGEEAMRLRTQALLGEKSSQGLVYLREATKYGTIEGLLSPPGIEKPNANHMILFVNGRWVKDKTLRYGVLRGYQSHLLKGRFPVVVMYLNMDPTLVDVNVHPSKTEVRLQYAAEVQGTIAQAIRGAMRAGAWVHGSAADSPFAPPPQSAMAMMEPPSAEAPADPRRSVADFDLAFGRESDNSAVYEGPKSSFRAPPRESVASLGMSGSCPERTPFAPKSFASAGISRDQPRNMEVIRTRRSYDIEGPSAAPPLILPFAEAPLPQKGSASLDAGPTQIPPLLWSEATFLGSYASCYLLFEYAGELMIVDQHAFHERILYERLLKDRAQLTRRQPLLVPEVVELGVEAKERLLQGVDVLRTLGFELRDVADTGIIEILSVPVLLVDKDMEALMQALSDAPLMAAGDGVATLDPLHDVMACIACHGAVRAGEEIDEIGLKQLLRQAGEVDFYHNCPHGRRVMRFFDKSEVAGWFDR